MSIACSVLNLVNVQIMRMALQDLQNQPEDADLETKLKGTGKLILALLFSQIFSTVLNSQNQFIVALLTQRIKHGINGLILDKVMMKSIQRDPTFSIGEITNLTQVDVERISNMGSFVNRIFTAPFELCIGLIWLYFLIGYSMFFGVFIIIANLVLNAFLAKKYKRYNSQFLDAKDRRGKLITEVFNSIRFIKMEGLENHFIQKIMKVRMEELNWVKWDFINAIMFIALLNITPLMFLGFMFGAYIYFYGSLTVPLVYTVLQIYNTIRWNFNGIPQAISWILDLIVSGQRVTFFLLSENIDTSYIKQIDGGGVEGGFAVQVENGWFYWEDYELKVLYKEEKDRIAKGEKKGGEDGVDAQIEEMASLEFYMDGRRRSHVLTVVPKSRLKFVVLRNDFERLRSGDYLNAPALSRVSDGRSLVSGATIGLKDDELIRENLADLTKSPSPKRRGKQPPEGALSAPLVPDRAQELDLQELYLGIKFNLKKIDFKVHKGRCVALIGKVGSGKSSLLSCLTGEMYSRLGSRITLSGSTSYVSQKAWIPSDTVKNCILFGKPFDQERYSAAIKYSCLEEDLKIFPKGDQTVLGDKGVNLSGGQKTRLSIARAMYSDSDIYLFDDPISALDIHVGRRVMEEGIVGYLGGKTRIVATHALDYLKLFDEVFVLDKGRIVFEGSYEGLLKTEVYQEIVGSIERKEVDEEDGEGSDDVEIGFEEGGEGQEVEGGAEFGADGVLPKKRKLSLKRRKSSLNQRKSSENLVENAKDMSVTVESKAIEDIIRSENRAEGNLSFSFFKLWLRLTGGIPQYLVIFCAITLQNACIVANPWFLQFWATNYSDSKMTRFEELKFFTGFYLGLNLIQMICDVTRLAGAFFGNLRLSFEVSYLMIFRLMHASVNKYFDRVPIGRLLNRFMKDVQIVDLQLARATDFWIWCM